MAKIKVKKFFSLPRFDAAFTPATAKLTRRMKLLTILAGIQVQASGKVMVVGSLSLVPTVGTGLLLRFQQGPALSTLAASMSPPVTLPLPIIATGRTVYRFVALQHF